MADKVNLHQLLADAGREVQARIARVGAYQHRSGVGDAREEVIRDYFTETLPQRFEVNKGKIFDSTGNLSAEFDVIISEKADCPPGMTIAGRRMVPVETVHGVMEVKSKLTRGEFRKFADIVRELGQFRRFYIKKPESPLKFTQEGQQKLQGGIRPDEYFDRINSIWSGVIAVDAPLTETVMEYLVDVPRMFTFLCVAGREVIIRGQKNELRYMPYGDASVPATMWMVTNLVSESVRPDNFIPDYGKYRAAFERPVFDKFEIVHFEH